MTTYNLTLIDRRTYIFTGLFVIANIVVPQLCHAIPGGGLRWLPIYLFTLIGAYKYGLRVGLLTALLSPIINHLIFAMPPAEMLPIVLTKSVIIALLASFIVIIRSRRERITFASEVSVLNKKSTKGVLINLILIVASSAILGTLSELIITHNLDLSLTHLMVGIPGLICHILIARLFFAVFPD